MLRLLSEILFKLHLPIIIIVVVFFVFKSPITKVFDAFYDKFSTIENRLENLGSTEDLYAYNIKIDSLHTLLQRDRKELTLEEIEAINNQLTDYYAFQQLGKINSLGTRMKDYKTRLHRLYSFFSGTFKDNTDSIPE